MYHIPYSLLLHSIAKGLVQTTSRYDWTQIDMIGHDMVEHRHDWPQTHDWPQIWLIITDMIGHRRDWT